MQNCWQSIKHACKSHIVQVALKSNLATIKQKELVIQKLNTSSRGQGRRDLPVGPGLS